jgi:hypothetical protein
MFLLDTDTISLMQFGHVHILQRAAQHPAVSIFISSISMQEQMKGWVAHAAQTRSHKQPRRLARPFGEPHFSGVETLGHALVF